MYALTCASISEVYADALKYKSKVRVKFSTVQSISVIFLHVFSFLYH